MAVAEECGSKGLCKEHCLSCIMLPGVGSLLGESGDEGGADTRPVCRGCAGVSPRTHC